MISSFSFQIESAPDFCPIFQANERPEMTLVLVTGSPPMHGTANTAENPRSQRAGCESASVPQKISLSGVVALSFFRSLSLNIRSLVLTFPPVSPSFSPMFRSRFAQSCARISGGFWGVDTKEQ